MNPWRRLLTTVRGTRLGRWILGPHGTDARELARLERSVTESAIPGRSRGRRRWVLGLSFLAAFLPLAVLLGLQYLWLQELEEASAGARQRTLSQELEYLDSALGLQYKVFGEKILSLPRSALAASTQGSKEPWKGSEREEWVAGGLKKYGQKLDVARTIFVVDFRLPGDGLTVFDAQRSAMVVPPLSPEVRAISVATAPFRVLYEREEMLEPVEGPADLVVDERDPRFRILMNPVTDAKDRPVGVAGMVLDEAFLVDSLLPSLEKKYLWRVHQNPDLSLALVDGGGTHRFSVGTPEAVSESDSVEGRGVASELPSRHLSFVFQDWRLELSGDYTRPEQWARANFIYNLTLSSILVAVVLGGIGLVLRAAAREMRLSQLKNDFVSNVSHELRTPLASIRVFGELLRMGRVESDEKIREYGEYIEGESRRLTGLINNILDFSRIESGEKIYHFEETDLGEVVGAVLETFEVRLRNSGFRVDYQGPATPLPLMHLDPGAVRQALCNLLDNAVKYSNGSREVLVGLRRRGGEAVLTVADRGIGIPREEQNKIFERFHRAASSLVHDVKGSGLGLSIVVHVVQAHGGHVRVDSEPGRGSTFSLHFPLSTRPPSNAGPSDSRAPGSALAPRPQESA